MFAQIAHPTTVVWPFHPEASILDVQSVEDLLNEAGLCWSFVVDQCAIVVVGNGDSIAAAAAAVYGMAAFTVQAAEA